jgi:hypothetical protein
MKKLICSIVILAAAGLVCAGELETAAVSADLSEVDFTALRVIDLPVPMLEAVKAPVSSAWVKTVKKTYDQYYSEIPDLPEAALSELPEAARKQLQKYKEEAPGSLCAAYTMPVEGKIVFVIHQDRGETGLSATIFDTNGEFLFHEDRVPMDQ